jgi:site-specific recombinase XerD
MSGDRFIRVKGKGGASRLVRLPRRASMSSYLFGRRGVLRSSLSSVQQKEADMFVHRQTGKLAHVTAQDAESVVHYEDEDGKELTAPSHEFFAAHREATEDDAKKHKGKGKPAE